MDTQEVVEKTPYPGHLSSARVRSVDGLRGVAIAGVLLFHVCIWAGVQRGLGNHAAGVGRAGVDLFFVISGFCMVWPLTSGDGPMRRLDAFAFLRRRWWRLAPPYYVAMLCMLLASWLCYSTPGDNGFSRVRDLQNVFPFTAQSAESLAAHVAFLHSLLPAWERKLDGAYWSLGAEWQFYVLLPCLLPLWRRFGAKGLVIIMGLMTLSYLILAQAVDGEFLKADFGQDLIFARLPEFGTGMLLADWLARADNGWTPPIWLVALSSLAAVLDLGAYFYVAWLGPPLCAIAGALLLIAGIRDARVRRLLERSPLQFLGRISYSLYLVHGAVFMLLATPLTMIHTSTPLRLLWYAGLALPLSVLVARFGLGFLEGLSAQYARRVTPAIGRS